MTVARSSESRLTAVLGPTNTGKTHLAMERMLGHASGMIGFPLRLLARENYDRVVKAKGAEAVALITGEEKIVPRTARYFVCTVESMPLDRAVSFLAVDEIQLAADPERGHIFTDRLLRARGLSETMVMGADTSQRWIRTLVPDAEFIQRPRFSTLTYAGPRKITRLPPRSAVVAFSAAEVYSIAELIRRQRGGTAIVMGALSPRTRNAQVELYQAGEVDYLVATDAIGMGLNMDVHHVAFAGLRKFDGRSPRPLTKAEIGQIAGRAGRHMTDGTFGTTADAGAMDPEIVEAVENHRFDPLPYLMWRSADLDFRSIERLLHSLERRPPVAGLIRQQEGEDQLALRHLSRDPEVVALADGRDRVMLLWEICQVPDFRKLMTDAHTKLLAQLFQHLTRGDLPNDWVAEQVDRLDRVEGDIDQLTSRISHIRTWTYIANRGDWVADPKDWQARTQAVEDRLSDALHQALTQRFVDRRHAALHRRLRDGGTLMGSVTDSDEVLVEGHVVGRLQGLRFEPAADASAEEARPLLAAARRTLGPAIAKRVAALSQDRNDAFRLLPDGRIAWRDAPIARLAPGDTPLRPGLQLLEDDLIDGRQRRSIEQRLKAWLESMLRHRLKPLFAAAAADLPAGARGLVYQLIEHLGAMPRARIADSVARLTLEERQALAKLDIKFGRETIWLSGLNERRQRRILGLLFAVHHGFDPAQELLPGRLPGAEPDDSLGQGWQAATGHRLVGGKRFEFGALERLSAKLRARAARGPVATDAGTAEALGLAPAELELVIRDLGYQRHKRDGAAVFAKAKRKRPVPVAAAARPDSPFAVLAGLKVGR